MSSTEARKDGVSRPKVRYESYENKVPPHTSSLKIKLKSKPSLDIQKLREGVKELIQDFSLKSEELNELLTTI